MNGYLFLDIDGVLNSQMYFANRDTPDKSWEDNIDPAAVHYLNDFIEQTKVNVVVSSTWRTNHTMNNLQDILEDRGFKHSLYAYTPHGDSAYSVRGNEIYQFLKERRLDSTFKKYVIFDDDSDMLLCQANNYFRCDGCVGLTPNVCYRAARFLESIK